MNEQCNEQCKKVLTELNLKTIKLANEIVHFLEFIWNLKEQQKGSHSDFHLFVNWECANSVEYYIIVYKFQVNITRCLFSNDEHERKRTKAAFDLYVLLFFLVLGGEHKIVTIIFSSVCFQCWISEHSKCKHNKSEIKTVAHPQCRWIWFSFRLLFTGAISYPCNFPLGVRIIHGRLSKD